MCVSINTLLDAATGKNKKLIMSNFYQNTDQNYTNVSFRMNWCLLKNMIIARKQSTKVVVSKKKHKLRTAKWIVCCQRHTTRSLCWTLSFKLSHSTWRSNYPWFHTSTGASKVVGDYWASWYVLQMYPQTEQAGRSYHELYRSQWRDGPLIQRNRVTV